MAVTQLHCGSVHYRVGCETSPTRSSGDRTRVDWGHPYLTTISVRICHPSGTHASGNASATLNVGLRIFRSVVSNFRTRRMAGALLRFRTRSSVGAHGSRAQPPAALVRVVSSRPHLGCCQDGSVVAPRPRIASSWKEMGQGIRKDLWTPVLPFRLWLYRINSDISAQ